MITERDIWELDQRINLRGVHVDIDSAQKIITSIKRREAERLTRFSELVRYEVSGPRSYVALAAWVGQEIGQNLDSIDKAATAELLKDPQLPAHVREVLQIKAELSKSSVAKYEAMVNRAHKGRVMGLFMYHGASTGRWAARGIQPHNMPRDSYNDDQYDLALESMDDFEWLSALLDDPYYAASKMLRGTICAPEGYELVCADFSAIEGRGLAYLADETWVLDEYRRIDTEGGPDMYMVTAATILGKPADEITKAERQSPGKIAELACGYQGAAGAVRQFGGGEGMTDEEVVEAIVAPWRATRPRIVNFWYDVERAAIKAIKRPGGRAFTVAKIHFRVKNAYLQIKLPSGRVLRYFQPKVENVRKRKIKDFNPEHNEYCTCADCGYSSESITYWGVKIVDGKTTSQWTKIETYGGKLTENIVQAFCRDLLAEAMVRLDREGYQLVMHVHDEAVAEEKIGSKDLEEFCAIMSEVPEWAEGMPIRAEGWVGKRYRK